MAHKRWKTQDEFPGSISLPFGIKTSHTWHEIGQILRIINDLDIETFIELGCHVGGLASIVGCNMFYKSFKYVGVDSKAEHFDNSVDQLFALQQEDIFESPEELINKHRQGKTFVYCDDGDKVKEMNIFYKFLLPGDVIACHDYWDGQEVVDLHDFGYSDACGCVPEVAKTNLVKLFDDRSLTMLPPYLLKGTRIMGFMKR